MLGLINYSIKTLYKATSHEMCVTASFMTDDLSQTHVFTTVLLSRMKSERGAAGLASRRNDGM